MSHILLLEPNTVLSHTYEAALTKSGHSVVRASTAQAAINAADAQCPDLVILELQLAKHSGIEFLHEFRSYPEWEDIPVVLHTMIQPLKMAGLELALRHELGVSAVLYKPKTSLEQLLRVITEQLAAA